MKIKSIYIAIGLITAGCNNGTLNSANSTNSQDQNMESRTLASLTTNSNQVIGGSGLPLGFKELQIGMGYDPSTDKVYPGGAPKLSKFAYTTTDGSIEKALLGCNTYEFHSRASEFAELKSTSSKSIFSGEAGLGVNYGLAKLSVAAKYNQQDSSLSGSASIQRQIGANTSCKIYTLIDGQTGVEYADRVGQAMLNGNEIMRQIISDIRNSRDYDERSILIKKFYDHFGTHMISGLTLGEMAVTSLSMTQQMDQTEAQKSGSAAVEFSVPFVSAKAGAEFATASKFDAKSWNVSIYEDFIPGDTKLKDEIIRLKNELDNAKKNNGVIDFASLTPKAVEIKDPVHQPDLSKYKIESSELKTAANVRLAVNIGYQNVSKIKNLMAKLKQANMSNKTYYKTMLEPLKVLNEKNLIIISDADYLTSADRTKYETKIAPYANEWDALPVLFDKAINETQQQAFAAIDEEIFNILKLANDNQKDAQTQTDSEESAITENNKFRLDYPTIAAYLEKKYYPITKVKYCKQAVDCSYEDWYKIVLVDGSDELKSWQIDYDNQFNKRSLLINHNSLFVQKNRQRLLAVKKNKNSLLTSLVSDSDRSAEEAIYKDRIITDFNLVAWTNIFPELLNKYTVKDLSEQAENALKASIKPYYLAFGYLQFAKHYDPILANLFADEVHYKEELDCIKTAIDSSGTSHLVNVLDKDGKLQKSYNMDSIDDMAELSKKINYLISHSRMFSQDWGQAVQALMSKGIISRFGSLAGINPSFPQQLAGFGWMIDSTKIESLPTTDALKAKKEKSPLALALELVASYYHKAFHTDNKLTRLFTYSSGVLPYYQDNNFKNKMVSRMLPVPMSLIENFLDNNKPTRILGIVPLVTSYTKVNGNKISKLAIIDSAGRIWGLGDNDNYNKIINDNGLNTYSIDLSSNVNPSDYRDAELFPAYQLTPDNGGKIQEVRWGIYSGSTPLNAVNKIFLSGLSPNIFAPENSSQPQGDVAYQSTFATVSQGVAILNKYSNYLPYSGSDEFIKNDSYFTNNGDVFSGQRMDYYYPYPSQYSFVAGINPTLTLLIGAGYGIGLGYANDHWNQCGSDKYCMNNINGSLVSYNLVITPVNNNIMNVLVDELPKTPQKQPLFPIYSFSN